MGSPGCEPWAVAAATASRALRISNRPWLECPLTFERIAMLPATTALRGGAAALALCLALALPAAAERPEPPPYYAIRDARVVTAPG